MAETAALLGSLDVSAIEDPAVRRTLRALQEQFETALKTQQTEIAALLELMLERNLASIGEFRRQLQKLQQGLGHRDRIAEAMASLKQPASTPPRPM